MSSVTDEANVELARPSQSRRDPAWLQERLTEWIVGQEGPDAAVTAVEIPSANGMSSETLLVTARINEIEHNLVVRVAPMPDSDPVFPSYDLDGQFQLIGHIAENTDVPLPKLWWSEPDPGPLGAPFFVMSRVDGVVPPDVMPYTFGSWVSEASAHERADLMRNSVGVLAAVHSAPIIAAGVAHPDPNESPLRGHIRRLREFYNWAKDGRTGAPLIERAFAWVDDNFPEQESDAVLCWGDARIGNIMYREFAPVAVLDWEMATVGPPELDVAWMLFLHRFFQDLAELAALPGLPDFLVREDVVAEYQRQSGRVLADMDFYSTYSALFHAVIMFRVNCRAIHFGQAAEPADPDDMILHRATLEAMMAGTYWKSVQR